VGLGTAGAVDVVEVADVVFVAVVDAEEMPTQ